MHEDDYNQKRQKTKSFGKDVEKLEALYLAGGIVK